MDRLASRKDQQPGETAMNHLESQWAVFALFLAVLIISLLQVI